MAMQWTSVRVGMIGTNCYLVKDPQTGKGAIIDPGDEAGKIQAAAEAFGLKPEVILLTHGHFDHILAANDLKAAYPGIRVYIHKADLNMEQPYQTAPLEVTDFYDEGDTVRAGGLRFTVLHTPGHTKGGVTLQCENVLFTGDTLFKGSMGRTDFPGGSEEEIFASLRRLAGLEGDYQVCPGHEGISTLEAERKSNYCLHYALSRR